MVHNTAWIVRHFHLTVSTTVALTFMGVSYRIFPQLTDRELIWKPLALIQPYLWFVGMMLFGVVNYVTGIWGMPRRVYSATYFGAEQAARWEGLTALSALGGIILFVSSGCFLAVLLGSLVSGRRVPKAPSLFAEPLAPPTQYRGLWDRIGLWTVIAIVLIAIAYGPPIAHLLSMERFGSLPFTPF